MPGEGGAAKTTFIQPAAKKTKGISLPRKKRGPDFLFESLNNWVI